MKKNDQTQNNELIFKQAYEDLLPHFEGDLLLNESLFKYTTLRVGGSAALYAKADSLHDLKLLLNYCLDKSINFFIIGRGANLLISDNGYEGLVIHLGRDFNFLKVDPENARITAGSAVSLARVLQEAYSNSLDGLAFCAGIPATVGGAIASNAGAFGGNICDFVSKINVLTKDGLKFYEQPLKSSYRKGPLLTGEVVVEAIFQLKRGDKMTIKGLTERYFKKKKTSQPLNYANAGSVFKNPSSDVSAGELIEKCKLKGVFVGDAMISEEHANFIINKGKARAADVYELLRLAQNKVEEKFDVKLETEIKLIGKFDEY